jgi:hypothetical protein
MLALVDRVLQFIRALIAALEDSEVQAYGWIARPSRCQHGWVTYPIDLGVIAATDRVVIRPWQPDEADRLYDASG